ncbi:hypothetical protein KDX38_12045 [Pseudomonas sp. CDFA 602]|uniref:hypothetical protein n=1 Tax=Pseudomonas californiensis TaxID=2829823 RepID=UPI001E316C4F|nr:hypothetical protein [Pseudomonas californiensis]MCD5994345.1 hypothetical protein [Pseudomonas californiensis]MCD5999947.1 hypothetical protein [Pseudomonas californiensis]
MSSPERSILSGTSLVSFGHGISPDLGQDILDCLLYAQLKADEQHTSKRSWRPWFYEYQMSISASGARPHERLDDDRLEIQSLRDLDRLPLRSSLYSPELRDLFRASLEALVASDHAQTFFNSWFTSGRSESFQVVPCTRHNDDQVTLMMCGLQLTTSALRPAFLFWQALSGQMIVDVAGGAFRFSRRAFDPFRDAVGEALSRHALKRVIEL